MNVERVDKEPGKEPPSKKVADMDSLCEEISRAIVEGLVEKEILDEPEIGTQPESHFAETAVIGSLDEVHTEQVATAVGSLLESDVLSGKIVQLVQEKIQQFLSEDAVQSRRGDSGIIAERVHVECARLFESAGFKDDVMKLLRVDVERTLAPALRRDMSACLRSMVTEVAGLLVERVAGEFAKLKTTSPPLPPAAGVPAATPAGEQRAEASIAGTCTAPRAGDPGTAAPAPAACLAPPAAEQPAAVQPAVVQPAAVQPAAVQPAVVQPPVVQPAADVVADRPGTGVVAPGKPLSSRCVADADERAASAYLRIRDRLLWQGAL